ncbi:hypothetical protein GB928_018475 [Shinella curvata]|uniref:Holin n=1 Tax=Shinella curvata TaxID=1817964 RepID=A0ABT8XHH1_9HYPH|nr:hypothetical protein [Shinella curvata]MCJ8053846.1 hypothetical protein [Shinella curvata]MDO6123178.1 hypothetical protein [Shinella curvata]
MKTSKKIDLWFWGVGTVAVLDKLAGDQERARMLIPILFMALFASYIAELIERQD